MIGNPTGLTGTVSDSSPVVQPPGERLSGAALPPATPTPAIDAKGYFDSGQAFLRGKEYDKAIGALNEAIPARSKLRGCIHEARSRIRRARQLR